jgi:ABC-type glycerol-3-phosphate transport system substrate-binding protein
MKWFSRGILVLMVIAGTLLLAFGPRPHHQIPPGRVVVSYWEKWGGQDAEPMRRVVDQFNNTVGKEKGIYVEYLSMANVHYKTLAATAAGVPPDVAGLWPDQVVQYSLRDAAMPIDELAREYHISADTYKRVFWDMCNYNGHLYALPTTPAVIGLHYNKKFFCESANVLRAQGLDPTRPPRSIAEFDRYAAALDKKIPGTNRLARAGFFTLDSGWYITVQQIWFGGATWDVKQQRYDLLTPQNIAAFDWIASYSRRMGKEGFSDFQSGLGSYSSPTNPFLSGAVAMCQQGQWMGNLIARYMPDMSEVIVPFELEPFLPRVLRPFNYAWGVEAFPSNVPGMKDVSYCSTDVLVIPRGSKHPREAFEFMAFTQRQEQMESLCSSSGKNSPLKRVSSDYVYSNPNPYIDVFDRLADSPNATPVEQTPIYAEASSLIDLAAQQCYLLQKTPIEALTEAQQRIDQRLARYQEVRDLRRASRLRY